MDLGLKDRVAMVLGAGGGLGGATASALVEEGARVAACDLDPTAVAPALARTALPVALDLRDDDAPHSAVSRIEKELGQVEIMVVITGGPAPSSAIGVPAAAWHEHFTSMITSVFALADRVLPHMRGAGWGRIVVSTSSGVVTPIPMLAISNTLRSSLHGWAKTVSAEVARDGVTVNTVVPGRIATKRIAELDRKRAERSGKSVEEVEDESVSTIPARRYGRPSEFARTVAFLCSEPASYITGSSIRVDGGMIPSV